MAMVFVDSLITLPCYFRVHRAGSQLKKVSQPGRAVPAPSSRTLFPLNLSWLIQMYQARTGALGQMYSP